jgi:hypothetical protein
MWQRTPLEMIGAMIVSTHFSKYIMDVTEDTLRNDWSYDCFYSFQ